MTIHKVITSKKSKVMLSQIVEGVSAADENENNKVGPQVISNGLALDRATLKEQKKCFLGSKIIIFTGNNNNIKLIQL